MMKLVFIFSLFMLLSCDDGFQLNLNVRIDPSLSSIVDEFYLEAESRGFNYNHNVSVILDPNMTEVGLFYRAGNVILMQKKFVMDKINKDSANYNFVKLAVFHEFGHWLGQGHRGGVSIMNTHPDFGGCKCGDFITTVQFYNKDKANQLPIIDEFFFKH